MARFLLILLAFALLPRGTAAAVEAVDFGRYHALVVGINDYKHLPNLETAVNDASAVHDVLRRDYGFASTLLLNPTRYELVRALRRLRARLTPRDNLVIYYAGHGELDEETGDGYWLPADAETDSQANWVAVHTVTSTVKAMSAKHVLVVADSCYSGTLAREAPVLIATGAERAAELRRISKRRARKALTSGALEPVADGGGDGHSVFARAFLDALRGNREVLDGHSLYIGLRRAVIVGAPQTPIYADIRFAGDEGGDFLFVPVILGTDGDEEPVVAATPGPIDPKRLELSFWESIKDSENPEAFEAYIAQFPDGTFVRLAEIRLQALAGRQEAALAPVQPESEAAEEIVNLVSWGGAWSQAVERAYVGPFTKQTGITVNMTDYNGGIAEIRAQVEAGNVNWDVVDMTPSDAYRACEEGLLIKLSRTRFPWTQNWLNRSVQGGPEHDR